jgi:hypothetical protein
MNFLLQVLHKHILKNTDFAKCSGGKNGGPSDFVSLVNGVRLGLVVEGEGHGSLAGLVV